MNKGSKFQIKTIWIAFQTKGPSHIGAWGRKKKRELLALVEANSSILFSKYTSLPSFLIDRIVLFDFSWLRDNLK